jgi:hypothetical protein
MTTPRAADLPVGSVVATAWATFIKVDMPGYMWRGTTTPPVKTNDEVDKLFVGEPTAQVLRVGDGSI